MVQSNIEFDNIFEPVGLWVYENGSTEPSFHCACIPIWLHLPEFAEILSQGADLYCCHGGSDLPEEYDPPAARLVCVEPNPGPKQKGNKNKSKAQKPKMPKQRTQIPLVPKQDGLNLGSIGSNLGRWLGGKAERLIDTLTGAGDYTVSSNTMFNAGAQPPTFSSNQSRGLRVQWREYLGDVLSSVAFTTRYSLALNAGLASSFPRLGPIADAFEQFIIHGCVFCFKSTSGSAISSTNNALGTIIMATEYNSNNPDFTSKITMENYQFSVSGKPSSEYILHPIECKRNATSIDCLYTRNGSLPPANLGAGSLTSTAVNITNVVNLNGLSDLRLNDLGRFQLATVGMQADNVNVGELWVTYDIELLKPREAVSPSKEIDVSLVLASPVPDNLFSDATEPLFPTFSVVNGSSIVPRFINGNTIAFGILPVGKYLFSYYIQGNTANTIGYPIPIINGQSFLGCALFPATGGGYSSYIQVPAGLVNSSIMLYQYCFVITSTIVSSAFPSGFQIQLPGGTFPVGGFNVGYLSLIGVDY
jgi:hypothetical protein